MSERKHNWELDGLAITAGTDNICYMGVPAQYAGDISEMCPNWEANARLIAASPDMLAALEAFDQLSLVATSCVRRSDPTNLDAMNAAVQLVRAAISKATGGGS